MTNIIGHICLGVGYISAMATWLGNSTAISSIPTELTSNASIVGLMGYFLWSEKQRNKNLESQIKEERHRCGTCPHVRRSNELTDYVINKHKSHPPTQDKS